MRALPTTYSGIKFRSRLEADWASTMDAYGLKWEYEPEGYALDDGTYYSPDFWLPTANAWLEVKGSHNQRISKVEEFAAQLWRESGAGSTYDRAAPMVLIGREPHRLGSARIPGSAWLSMIGTQGGGSAYSVKIVRCPSCSVATVIAWTQPWCRCCGQEAGEWFQFDYTYATGWHRVPRPVGRIR
jgi:hypothetical protein